MTQFGSGAQSPDDVADVIVGVLTADDPPLRTQTSDWSREFVGRKLADLDGAAILGATRTWVS